MHNIKNPSPTVNSDTHPVEGTFMAAVMAPHPVEDRNGQRRDGDPQPDLKAILLDLLARMLNREMLATLQAYGGLPRLPGCQP
jgi:hypothetical protein